MIFLSQWCLSFRSIWAFDATCGCFTSFVLLAKARIFAKQKTTKLATAAVPPFPNGQPLPSLRSDPSQHSCSETRSKHSPNVLSAFSRRSLSGRLRRGSIA